MRKINKGGESWDSPALEQFVSLQARMNYFKSAIMASKEALSCP